MLLHLTTAHFRKFPGSWAFKCHCIKFEGFLNDDCSGTDLDEDVEAIKSRHSSAYVKGE